MTTQQLSRVDVAISNAVGELQQSDAVIEQLREEFMPLTVDGPGDLVNGKAVSEALKRVKRLRINVEKRRKELKADALKFGKAVDGEAKRLAGLIEPIEAHLTHQEQIAEDNLPEPETDADRVMKCLKELFNVAEKHAATFEDEGLSKRLSDLIADLSEGMQR